MEIYQRLRVAGPSASRTRSQRLRRWGIVAGLFACVLVGAASVCGAPISPVDVHVELPIYSIAGPADRLNERWTYRFSWSGIPVGDATITVTEKHDDGQAHLAVDVVGATNALVDLLWRYRVSATDDMRLDPFAPATFVCEESERGAHKETRIEFDDRRRAKSYRRKGDRDYEYELAAANTYDMISTVFLAMNLDYRQGDVLHFDTLTGTARYLVQVTIAEREQVAVAGHVYDGRRLEIVTSELTDPNEAHKHEATELWVSAERPRRLLRARSKTFIGAIYVDLTAIETLDPVTDRHAASASPFVRRTSQHPDLSKS